MSIHEFVEDDLSEFGNKQITILEWMTLNEKGIHTYNDLKQRYAKGQISDTLKHCMIAKNPSGIDKNGKEKSDNICFVSKVRTVSAIFIDRENDPPLWAYTRDTKLYALRF